MSVESVKNYLIGFGLGDKIKEFDISTATVDEAAAALGTDGKRIAKTMSFIVDEKAILIVMAGDVKTDNSKFKAQFHTKASMISRDNVLDLTGHPVGGVCPFNVKEGVNVFLDESLKRFDTVFPACGSPNSAIELTIPELEKASKFSGWVDVGKTIQ